MSNRYNPPTSRTGKLKRAVSGIVIAAILWLLFMRSPKEDKLEGSE